MYSKLQLNKQRHRKTQTEPQPVPVAEALKYVSDALDGLKMSIEICWDSGEGSITKEDRKKLKEIETKVCELQKEMIITPSQMGKCSPFPFSFML